MILCMVAYAVMTGLASSVMRATLMLTLVCALRWSGRKVSLGQVWLLALMILLVYQPEQMFLPGFQLSFAAVGSIVMSQRLIANMDWPSWPSYVLRLIQTMLVMVCLTLGTAPLTYYHFGTVVWTAPLFNLVMVPLASCVVMGALVLFICDGLGLSVLVTYVIAPWLEKLLQVMFYLTGLSL